MEKLNLTAFVPIMDVVLYFDDDKIEVIVTDLNMDGKPPTIIVCNEGDSGFPEIMRTPIDSETQKKYSDFILEKIKNGELLIPYSINLNPLSGKVEIDECIML